MSGRARQPRNPADLRGAPIDPAKALDLGTPQRVAPSEQVLLLVDVVDVHSQRMPEGTEMRTLSIPTKKGDRVYLVPLTADYAYDLGRRLQRGAEAVTPLVPDGHEPAEPVA